MISCIATLTNPVAGREDGYVRWYVDQHLGDILKLPGVLNGQFFQIGNLEGARWRHHAWFEVETSRIRDTLNEIARRRGGADMPMTDAMDSTSVVFLVATALGSWRTAPGAVVEDVEGADCRLLALSNPVAGREAEFERWYDDQHLPDVLRVPGFVGGQRFGIDPSARGPPPPWSRLATYAARPSDPSALTAQLRARAGTADMPLTDALDRSAGFTGLFVALTPRRRSNH